MRLKSEVQDDAGFDDQVHEYKGCRLEILRESHGYSMRIDGKDSGHLFSSPGRALSNAQRLIDKNRL